MPISTTGWGILPSYPLAHDWTSEKLPLHTMEPNIPTRSLPSTYVVGHYNDLCVMRKYGPAGHQGVLDGPRSFTHSLGLFVPGSEKKT